MARGTDVWVLGTDFGGRGGRRRGGVVGIYQNRPNGVYGEGMRPPLFLRVTITDRSPDELSRMGKFHMFDKEQKVAVRHPWVLDINNLPRVLREQLVVTGHIETTWGKVSKFFRKNARFDFERVVDGN